MNGLNASEHFRLVFRLLSVEGVWHKISASKHVREWRTKFPRGCLNNNYQHSEIYIRYISVKQALTSSYNSFLNNTNWTMGDESSSTWTRPSGRRAPLSPRCSCSSAAWKTDGSCSSPVETSVPQLPLRPPPPHSPEWRSPSPQSSPRWRCNQILSLFIFSQTNLILWPQPQTACKETTWLLWSHSFFLITNWWLAAVQVIHPASMLANGIWTKLKSQSTL